MVSVKYSGLIRPDKMSESRVLKTVYNLVKFLEINGDSQEARQFLNTIEELEHKIKSKQFNN